MLPRSNRLPTPNIRKLLRFGKQVRDNGVTIRYEKNMLTESRFAFVVGTNIEKRAVKRIAIKRSMRHAIRNELEHIPGGWDIVCIAVRQVGDSVKVPREKNLIRALKKLGIYKQ